MTTKTVTWVADDIFAQDFNGKTTYYINVAFEDESTGSLGKQDPAKAGELKAMLEGLKGQPAEFGLEDKGQLNKKNQPKYKIKSFPGYEPAPFGGGGSNGGSSRGYTPRFTDTEAGFHINDERVDRRKALELAVAATVDLGQVLPQARKFYDWLRQDVGGTTANSAGAPSGQAAQDAAPPTNLPAWTQGQTGSTSLRASAPEGETEGGGSVLGEVADSPPSDKACLHTGQVSNKNPAGKALPQGTVRCLQCGRVFKETQ